MKKTLKKHLNKKGLTLLEVIITIAIVSIIIPVAFSVLGFGNKTFNSGISRRDIQQNVRNISTVIVDEIRYATKEGEVVEIRNSLPDEVSDDKIYLIISSEGFEKYKGDSQIFSFVDKDIDFSESTIKLSGKNMDIKIKGVSGSAEYEAETSVYPLNEVDLDSEVDDIDKGISANSETDEFIKISSKGE